MRDIEVSVIVVTYNHEKYIKECLDSILCQQTNFNFEIILGEDESSDNTRDICIDYAKNNPDKIRLFLRNRKDVIVVNGNPTGRYNFLQGIKASKGKYIAFCEGDDFWINKNKLQAQYDILESKSKYIAVHHWQKHYIYNGTVWEMKNCSKNNNGYLGREHGTVEDIFSNKLRIKSRTIFFRNIFLTEAIPDFIYKTAFGDVPLSYILGKYGDFFFIDKEWAVYRLVNTGLSKAGLKELGEKKFRIRHWKNWIEIWDYANKFYKHEYNKQARYTISQFYRSMIRKDGFTLMFFLKLNWYTIFTRKESLYFKMYHLLVIYHFFFFCNSITSKKV